MIYSYTDWHDVDEDLRTGVRQGGEWNQGIEVGIAYLVMYETPTALGEIVASMKKK